MTAVSPPSPDQAAALRRLKDALDAAAEAVEATDDAGRVVARLTPITRLTAEDDALVNDLYRWRAAAMSGFLTVFEPTPEKTRGYLRHIALADPARILFLVSEPDGRPVGNIGLCNVAPGEAEVDNVVRGERTATPGFMAHVQRALIDWAARTLGVERIYLNVLSDNERAIASYARSGYVETGRTPLVREDTADGWRLVPTPGAPDPALTLVRMEAPVAPR